MSFAIMYVTAILIFLSAPVFSALTAPSTNTGSSLVQRNDLPAPTIEKSESTDKQLPSAEEEQLLEQKRKSAAAAMCLMGARYPDKCATYKKLYNCSITCRTVPSANQSSLVEDLADKKETTDNTESAPAATSAANPAPTATKTTPVSSTTQTRTPAKTTTPTASKAKAKAVAESEEDTSDDGEADAPTAKAKKATPTDTTGDPQDQPETKQAKDEDKPAQSKDQMQKSQADNSSDSNSGDTGESDALDRCNSLYSSAVSACNVTDDTESASNSDSLTDACHQSTSKGVTSSKSKTTAANACTSAFSNCQVTCDDYARKFTDGDYSASFSSRSYACAALSNKVDEILSANQSSIDLAQSGLDCTKSASESPQTASGEAAQKRAKAAAEAASSICAADPTSPSCAQAARTAAALESSGGFGEAKALTGNLAPADETGEHAFSGLFQTPSSSASNATVPNNAGGSIPGGSSSANAGAPEKKGLLAAIGSAITDIEQGFLGGGYSQLIRGENPWADDLPSDLELRQTIAILRGEPPPSDKIDSDLKRYLPGGDLYRPKDRSPASQSQFHGAYVDIFQRIHDRYEVICRLGNLVGCENGMPIEF